MRSEKSASPKRQGAFKGHSKSQEWLESKRALAVAAPKTRSEKKEEVRRNIVVVGNNLIRKTKDCNENFVD